MEEESSLAPVVDFINEIIITGEMKVTEKDISEYSSLEQIITNISKGSMSIEGFHLLRGIYRYYAPESCKFNKGKTTDEILIVENEFNEPSVLLPFLGQNVYSFLYLHRNISDRFPLLLIPQILCRGDMLRDFSYLEDPLFQFSDQGDVTKLILVGFNEIGSKTLTGEQRVFAESKYH